MEENSIKSDAKRRKIIKCQKLLLVNIIVSFRQFSGHDHRINYIEIYIYIDTNSCVLFSDWSTVVRFQTAYPNFKDGEVTYNRFINGGYLPLCEL